MRPARTGGKRCHQSVAIPGQQRRTPLPGWTMLRSATNHRPPTHLSEERKGERTTVSPQDLGGGTARPRAPRVFRSHRRPEQRYHRPSNTRAPADLSEEHKAERATARLRDPGGGTSRPPTSSRVSLAPTTRAALPSAINHPPPAHLSEERKGGARMTGRPRDLGRGTVRPALLAGFAGAADPNGATIGRQTPAPHPFVRTERKLRESGKVGPQNLGRGTPRPHAQRRSARATDPRSATIGCQTPASRRFVRRALSPGGAGK
jgi:hypothetical protein